MSQRVTIILFLLSLAITSFSQKILKITNIEESNAIFQDYIEVYVDSTNSLDFDQISSEDYQQVFCSRYQNSAEETSIENTYWLHFILDYNPLECNPWVYKSHNNNQIVEVYTIIDGSMQMQKTGTNLPSISNDEIIPSSNIILIRGSGQIEYYLRLNSVKFRHPNFNLAFYDLASEFRMKNSNRHLSIVFSRDIVFNDSLRPFPILP